MSKNEFAVECNYAVNEGCDKCTESCIMKFTDEEWESFKMYHTDIISALQEQEMVEDAISEYYRLKKELNKKGINVEDVVNIDIKTLRQRKKEISKRIELLRQLEFNHKRNFE